jgi:hypothetical protein
MAPKKVLLSIDEESRRCTEDEGGEARISWPPREQIFRRDFRESGNEIDGTNMVAS